MVGHRHRYGLIPRSRVLLLAPCLLMSLPVEPALPKNRCAPVLGYEVVKGYPHDHQAFTQGLLWADGALYESTGGYGNSTLRRVELETGQVLDEVSLPAELFGEGIATYGDRIVQLTWRSRLALLFDRRGFRYRGAFRYPTEGWGLAYDGTAFILSDGSATLYFLNPQTFREQRRVTVREAARPIDNLNELEMVEGRLYANIWHSDRIAIIDPSNGRLEAWVDLAGLLPSVWQREREDVLNGIAYDPAQHRLFVTGKNWPQLFEIRVIGQSPSPCPVPSD